MRRFYVKLDRPVNFINCSICSYSQPLWFLFEWEAKGVNINGANSNDLRFANDFALLVKGMNDLKNAAKTEVMSNKLK